MDPVAQTVAGWWANHDIARVNFWVTHRLLGLRATHADPGAVQLLGAEGALATHVLAVQRGGSSCLAVVPRLAGALGARHWGDTCIRLPRGSPASWRSVLTDARIDQQDDCLPLSDLFADLPVAVVIPA